MSNSTLTHDQQPALQDNHPPDIAGAAFDALTMATKIASEVCGLVGNVPYVQAISGVVVKIAEVKDEMKNNKTKCANMIKRVCLDWKSVSANLVEISSTGRPELYDDLEKDLQEYSQILNELQAVLKRWSAGGARMKISRLINRDEFKDVMQLYESQVSAFHQRFQMNQAVRLRVAVTQQVVANAPKAAAHVIPPKPRVIIGRDKEMIKILDALKKQDETPVRAAILGPGGMGKTTIALSILHDHEIESRYKTERYFITCESANNAELLLNSIADTLGMPSAGRDQNQLAPQIVAFFRDRHSVVCFDNLETTWDDSAHRPDVNRILDLLSTIRTLVIIITMRGTQSPGGQDIIWLKVEIKPVALEDAYDIYRQRARREPDEWARNLVEAVDNIPLAVTLISHLVQEDGQSPQDLWARWQKGRTSILENGGSDRLSKLDASIWLSVQSPRMDDKSRNLLHLLSFLPDGLHSEFKLKIALPGVPDLSSLLITLQRVSLIYTSPIPDSTATRYNMLSPIREYCQKASNFTPPPWPEWRSAFTAFFADLVVEHWDPTNAMDYSIIVPDLRNIRSILMEMIQESSPNTQAANRYTTWSRYVGICDEEVIVKSLQFMHDQSDLAWGYRTLSNTQERKDNLDGAEDSLKKSFQFSEQVDDSCAMARALECIGDLQLRRNNLDEAESSLCRAQVLYDEVGSTVDRANIHFLIGQLHMRRNNIDDAEQSFATALPLYAETRDALGQAIVHRNLGELHMARGNLDDAEKSFSDALPLYQQTQDVLGQANVHRNIGELQMRRGDLDDAEASFSTSLTLYQQSQDASGQANVHRNMGELHIKRGDLDDAQKSFSLALALYEQIQHVLGRANVHCDMGELQMKRGDLDDAEQSFSDSLPLYQQIQHVLGQANVYTRRGELHMKRGYFNDAENDFSNALTLYQELRSTLGQANVHCVIGELHMTRGDLDDAEKSLSTALSLYEQIQHILGQANVFTRMGELHMKRGDLDDAENSFSTALALYQQIQDITWQAYVHHELGKLHLERDNFDAAEASFSTSLAMYEQLRDTQSQEIVCNDIRILEERKTIRLGDESTGEAVSVP